METTDYKKNQIETYLSFESENSVWVEGQRVFIDRNMTCYPRSARILDIACGDGVGLSVFRSYGFTRMTGCDLSEAKLTRALKHGYPVVLADMHNLEIFQDGIFDVVYSSHTLEHAHDPKKVLSEFFRVLRPQGHLVLVLPYLDTGPEEAHCGKCVLGTDRADDSAYLITFLKNSGFSLLWGTYNSFRGHEVWLRLMKS